MTQYSYSRVSLFNDCPYHFKLKYIDRLTEIQDLTNAANPL
ncbi:PD-(D/E)XK nuclease family protein, partial [Heyndrickxia oleronia]